ncbi:hypothetical protein HK405_003130 [Cladochytrium tenue]|nr:hypothetical protein HK405_003130 [Cladochytrium tenue]
MDLVPSITSDSTAGSDVAGEFAWLADELLLRGISASAATLTTSTLAPTAAGVVDMLRPPPPRKSGESAGQPPGLQVVNGRQSGDDGRKGSGGGCAPPSPGETMVATPAPTLAATSAAGSLVSLGGGYGGCRPPGTCSSGSVSPELPLHDGGSSGGVRPSRHAGRANAQVVAAMAPVGGTAEQLARLGVRLELQQRLRQRMAAREEAAAAAAGGGPGVGPRARVQRPFAGKYTCRRTPTTRLSAGAGSTGPSVVAAAAGTAKGGRRTASGAAAATDGRREAEARRRHRPAPVATASATATRQSSGCATLAGADENLHMQWPPRLLAPSGTVAAPVERTAAGMPPPTASATAAASGTMVAAGRGEDDGCDAWLLSPFLGALDAGSGTGGVADATEAFPVTVPLWAAGVSKTAPWAATAERLGVSACGDDDSLDWLAELLQLERQPAAAVVTASGAEAGGDFFMSCDGSGHGGDNFGGRGAGDVCWLWSGVVGGCNELGGGWSTAAAKTPQRAQLRQTLGATAIGLHANSFLLGEADGLLDWDVGGGPSDEREGDIFSSPIFGSKWLASTKSNGAGGFGVHGLEEREMGEGTGKAVAVAAATGQLGVSLREGALLFAEGLALDEVTLLDLFC